MVQNQSAAFANRQLAREINREARNDPNSPYAGKFVGIAHGQVVVVADSLDEVAEQLRRVEADPAKTFCIEAGVDYDAVQEIWNRVNMPRQQWPLENGRPVIEIALTLASSVQSVPRVLLADTGAGSDHAGFELILEEADCLGCGGIPAQAVMLGGAYAGAFPVYLVRVQIPQLNFDHHVARWRCANASGPEWNPVFPLLEPFFIRQFRRRYDVRSGNVNGRGLVEVAWRTVCV